MPRLRVTVTQTYDADPSWYGTDDPEEMAAIDQEEFDSDVDCLCSVLDSFDELTVTVEVVEDDE